LSQVLFCDSGETLDEWRGGKGAKKGKKKREKGVEGDEKRKEGRTYPALVAAASVHSPLCVLRR